MTLRVSRMEPPAAGLDWSYVVPGHYIENIVSVAATLTTVGSGPASTAIDASGNGNDGTYFPTLIQDEPGIIANDTAVGFPSQFPFFREPLTVPAAVIDATGDCTVAFWWRGDSDPELLSSLSSLSFFTLFTGPPMFAVNRGPGASVAATPFVDPTPGGTRFVVWRFNGANWYLYLNAALIASGVFGVGPPYPPIGPLVYFGNNMIASGTTYPTAIGDELAFFSSDIGAAGVAALYAAAPGGFGPYSAAVLARSPSTYYHLDDPPAGGGGRTVALVVTDGTSDVIQVPPGVAAVPTPGPYRYSWQTALSDGSQSTDATLTTVPIPPMILPGGYTIGTNTPDIQPTDQWSDISIWWNDDYDPNGSAYPTYEYPPGAFLVYRQEVVTP